MNDSSKPPKRTRKIGEGHAQAMLRQGLREAQALFYSGSNIAREPEPGMFGNPTQGEIAADRRPDQNPSIIDAHTHDARAQSLAARERASRGISTHEAPEQSRE